MGVGSSRRRLRSYCSRRRFAYEQGGEVVHGLSLFGVNGLEFPGLHAVGEGKNGVSV